MGEMNRQQLQHFLFHDTMLECMFSREYAKAGDRTSINVAYGSKSDDTDDAHSAHNAASVRIITDWTAPDRYWFAMPGGASGHAWSEYYTNMAPDWSANVYREVRIAGYDAQQTQTLS